MEFPTLLIVTCLVFGFQLPPQTGASDVNPSPGCEPQTCFWLGIIGRCSRTPIPGYTNIGQAECGNGCSCYVLNPLSSFAGRNSTLVPYTGSNLADAVEAYVNNPKKSEAECCIGVPPPICTELGCCCGVQNDGASTLVENIADDINTSTKECCHKIPPPNCLILKCCCSDEVNGKKGCELDGSIHPDGSRTSENRCLQYRCNNGSWEVIKQVNPACGECSTAGQTTITTFDVHFINGSLVPSYQFNGSSDPYWLTQSWLIGSQLGVKAAFENTGAYESKITYVAYIEPGITVAFVTEPYNDAQILVNGVRISLIPNGSMTPFNSSVGTVYISNESPSWPQPFLGGNINIVGSLGISVSIYALYGYAWFVNINAMPALENELYGLCDIFTNTVPENYTIGDGIVTTDITEFIEVWKVDDITDNRSSDDEITDELPPPFPFCGDSPLCDGPNTVCLSNFSNILCGPALPCYCERVATRCCNML